ncbi:MAG: CBS domain-containing protein [Hyphomicrobiaceae bacterium]
MKVSDILALKRKAKITIGPSENIGQLSLLLRENRVGAAVVSSDGQAIEGVISERDIAYGLTTHGADLHTLPVSTLMTKTVITCRPTDDIALVASTMLSRNIRHIPVEAGKQLIGMVSIRDVLNFRLNELQQQTAQFRTLVGQMGQPPQDRE